MHLIYCEIKGQWVEDNNADALLPYAFVLSNESRQPCFVCLCETEWPYPPAAGWCADINITVGPLIYGTASHAPKLYKCLHSLCTFFFCLWVCVLCVFVYRSWWFFFNWKDRYCIFLKIQHKALAFSCAAAAEINSTDLQRHNIAWILMQKRYTQLDYGCGKNMTALIWQWHS